MQYILYYLFAGVAVALILDISHRTIRKYVTEEEYENLKYTNYERLYTMVAWPFIVYGVIKGIIQNKQNEQ
tara:strand:- start:391 stop:603 length:213 start_codon:yes stop_codon:yes gene_type:complete